jgi:ABC transporter substrate binding protein
MEGGLGLTFKAATKTIPIVTIAADPVVTGFVSNIARPGGNITGVTIDAGLEIWGKRIGLLMEALPKLSNASIIAQTQNSWEGPYGSAIRQAAKYAGIALNVVVFDGKIDEAAYQRVFSAFEQHRPDALIATEYSVHLTNRATIVELAAKHRLPAMYPFREFVEVGGLMSYSPDLEEIGRHQSRRHSVHPSHPSLPDPQPQDRKVTRHRVSGNAARQRGFYHRVRALHRSPGHHVDGGSLVEIFVVRSATRWLRLYG